MLPAADDNGARLAAILPTGLAALAHGVRLDPFDALARAVPGSVGGLMGVGRGDFIDLLTPIRSFVMIVVDGLGSSNLKARAGHARRLMALPRRRIETVIPSTTAAALTTLVTGVLPGEHGLIGYRIKHPDLGIISPLKDWEGIVDPSAWQRATPVFDSAASIGVRSLAIGRPSHAVGGLTESILHGAEYIGGQRIEDRFEAAHSAVREREPSLIYLYVDELDKAGHEHGWESEQWLRRLEQFDAALEEFLSDLPGDVGVVVTADHGMVDVSESQQVLFDSIPWFADRIADVAGEPRMRSLFLHDPAQAREVADLIQAAEGDRAWVGTRDEAITAGWYGPMTPGVESRLGEVIVAARRNVAYYTEEDSAGARAMIGQHGSLSSDERGVPLAMAGTLEGSGFAAAVARVAASSARAATGRTAVRTA